MQVGYCFG